MLGILSFLEETAAPKNQWVMWIILGVMVVVMILFMLLGGRKNRKRAEEMMAKLAVGSIVTTIGGIVGEVVQMDDAHIWIKTGTEDNQTVMQFVRQAIHSIAPAPGSPEALAEEKAEKKEANEDDEIK